MPRAKIFAGVLAAVSLLGTAPRLTPTFLGTFRIEVPPGPYLPGSRVTLTASGANGSFAFSVLGPGTIDGAQFVAPQVGSFQTSTIIAAVRGAVASQPIRLAPAPAPNRPLLAVAAYDSGVALHDPRSFALLGYVGIGGPPGDVTFSRDGDVLTPDTDGATLTRVTRSPWQLHATSGVQVGNEVAVDSRTGSVFVTDRDVDGKGALTRIAADGTVSHIVTGVTAEGLALDDARGTVYVGNVNDDTVAEIDAVTMKLRRKIRSVERTFGMVLDANRQRLYVVSNTSPTMHSRAGYVAAIDVRRASAPIVARSAKLVFPLGVELDARRNRVFVTDESVDRVYVLNARTLAALRTPISTCRTPWRPRIAAGRLYVPCTRTNNVDVFDLATLRRVKGAPFATGGFPLSVALWP